MSPFQVVTVVAAGDTGIQLTETDSYVVGAESYRTDVVVSNTGEGTSSFVLYRAGELLPPGFRRGASAISPTASWDAHAERRQRRHAGDARIRAVDPDHRRRAPGVRSEGHSQVWAAIGSQQPFNNTCLCDEYIDNGAGLSWSGSVTPGTPVTYSPRGRCSRRPARPGPYLTKTAAADSVAPGSGDSYTITVNNPTGGDVTLNSLTDHLPARLHIHPRHHHRTPPPPTRPSADRDLTWTGSLLVPGGGTATLTFSVMVATEGGTYTNSVDATAEGASVTGTGPTAPVTVEGTEALVLQPRFTG